MVFYVSGRFRPCTTSNATSKTWKSSRRHIFLVVTIAIQMLCSGHQVESFQSALSQRTALLPTSTSPSSTMKSSVPSWEPSSSSSTLFGSRNGGEETTTKESRVRFTAGDNYANMDGDLIDTMLSTASSDVVSIVLGMLGLLWVVIHRLTLLDVDEAEALTVQTRTDLLAVLACGSVLLNGVTKLDVTTALAESVVLDGTKMKEPNVQYRSTMAASKFPEIKNTISWILDSLLTATPAKTVVLLQRNQNDADESSKNQWIVSGRAGVLPTPASSPDICIDLPDKTPILDRVGSPGNVKETYLPTLQALPGRFEFFSYLPSNTQLALLIPVAPASTDGSSSVEKRYNDILVIGSNTAKSFTPRDIAWTRIVAERITACQ